MRDSFLCYDLLFNNLIFKQIMHYNKLEKSKSLSMFLFCSKKFKFIRKNNPSSFFFLQNY